MKQEPIATVFVHLQDKGLIDGFRTREDGVLVFSVFDKKYDQLRELAKYLRQKYPQYKVDARRIVSKKLRGKNAYKFCLVPDIHPKARFVRKSSI